MSGNLSADSLRAVAESARKRLVQMHFEAGVGHLGGNLSCIDTLLTISHSFAAPTDEIVLSKGHSAGALYITLWSLGLIDDDELSTFHGDGTRLAGHPPAKTLPRVSFGTGSLGHGLSIAAGIALASKFKNESAQTFCVMSDGEWQEGSTWEALIFAHHHGLSNLNIFIDKNGLQGFGGTQDVASMGASFEAKLRAFTPNVRVVDGHDFEQLMSCDPASVERQDPNLPQINICETVKGNGIARFEGKMESHYLPITKDDFESFVSR